MERRKNDTSVLLLLVQKGPFDYNNCYKKEARIKFIHFYMNFFGASLINYKW